MSKPYRIWRMAFLLVAGLLFVLTSCKQESDDNLKPSMSVPLVYDSLGFAFNTQSLKPLIEQFSALQKELRRGNEKGTYVSEESLNAAFSQGTFSLRSVTTPYFISRLESQNNGFFAELSKASGGSFNPFDRSWEGGVYSGYLFDEYGLEVGQVIEKGLYGASLYNYAMSLTEGMFRPATADQILFLYGANPLFLNSDNQTFYPNPDRLMAAYAAQRDDGTGTGLYSQTRQAFITLQTALMEGEDFNEYRDEALATIKLNWEKTNAAVAIHDIHAAVVLLNTPNLSEEQRAKVMHWVSEAAGFLHGWRMIDAKNKKIKDAQIDEILALLNAPYDRSASVYRFVTGSGSETAKLADAVARIQGIYGFTNDEVESFRRNYVADQGR